MIQSLQVVIGPEVNTCFSLSPTYLQSVFMDSFIRFSATQQAFPGKKQGETIISA